MLQSNSDLSAASTAYRHIGKPNIEYIQTGTITNDKADAYNKRGIAYCENGEYDKGIAQFNSGLAARLAGVPRVEFIFLMGDYGLSPFGPDEEEYAKSGF